MHARVIIDWRLYWTVTPSLMSRVRANDCPPATPRHATPRHATPRHGTVRYGTVRYATVRYGTVRHGTVRYGTPFATLRG